jgi:polyhydroxybutyrate depolymerase
MWEPDIVFLAALIESMAADLCLDLARIYATGWSMGAGGVSVLGCVMDDRIAAVAPVSTTDDHGDACTKRRPVPVRAFHGTEDDVILYEGGLSEWFLDSVGPDGTRVLDIAWVNEPRVAVSYPDRLANIAIRNGCEPEPVSEMITPNVERLSWACPEGADVALVAAGGHGHSWPGSAEAATWALTTMEIDATEMIWEFFEQHPMSE